MPLHIDYRPSNFDEFFGSETTVKNLKNKVYGDDPPKAIIFYGPYGCGKTTLGYLTAEAVGCKTNSLDFTELDAVQTGNIDSAREIRENMNFHPGESKKRVWLIDEVQDSSAKFQSGLLKALESGPKHSLFILCTTELKKINEGIRSRATRFKVEKLNDQKMKKLLNWISKEEEVEIPNDVIDEIIKVAEGHPREAVKILDQIIDLDPNDMISSIEGTDVARETLELCQAMLKGKSWPELAEILKGMKDVDAERARQAIIGYFAAIALDKRGFNKKNKKQWEKVAARSAYVFDCFREPLFYTGMSGLAFSVYNTTLD